MPRLQPVSVWLLLQPCALIVHTHAHTQSCSHTCTHNHAHRHTTPIFKTQYLCLLSVSLLLYLHVSFHAQVSFCEWAMFLVNLVNTSAAVGVPWAVIHVTLVCVWQSNLKARFVWPDLCQPSKHTSAAVGVPWAVIHVTLVCVWLTYSSN
jgi:hypothetical protein